METCNLEPFRYTATPQPVGDHGASSNQINEQTIENYLTRLIEAVCADLTAIEARLTAIEARLDALEAP
jgi:hypothetical protein